MAIWNKPVIAMYWWRFFLDGNKRVKLSGLIDESIIGKNKITTVWSLHENMAQYFLQQWRKKEIIDIVEKCKN